MSAIAIPLTKDDFAYLGFFEVPPIIGTTPMTFLPKGTGLTSRKVGGQLNFLSLGLNSGAVQMVEYTVAGLNPGDTISSTAIHEWLDPFNGVWMDPPNNTVGMNNGNNNHYGMQWDEANQYMWLHACVDYTQPAINAYGIMHSVLGNNVITSTAGPWGVSGDSNRPTKGGMLPVPAWFQSRYGVGPYAVGFGGYTSLLSFSPAGLGLYMAFINNPHGQAAGTLINGAKYGSDMRTGLVQQDWYTPGNPNYNAGSVPLSLDRSWRLGGVTNLFDDPTAAGRPGYWVAPNPLGFYPNNWMDWNENNSLVWIDGANKHGIVWLYNAATGNTFYDVNHGNVLSCDSRAYEMQVFDPALIGAIASGATDPATGSPYQPWRAQPKSLWRLPELITNGMGGAQNFGNNWTTTTISGVTYDPVTKKLYCLGQACGGIGTVQSGPNSRIFVYSVDDSGASAAKPVSRMSGWW